MASHPQPTPLGFAARVFGRQSRALEPEEQRVIDKMHEQLPISRDAADVADERSTLGDRLADRVAAVGGSWGFIIGFTVILVGSMLLNTDILAHWGLAFDPYPYIFLNLMLSTLAAIQAPVIMMSQNRQAAKDRLAASLDYEVNLRTELEILRLHEKLDTMMAERLDRLIAAAEAGR
ncbi:MAG: DUF1003 domain-containing protein [Methylobacterium sp.]|nr:MAG: DUF1003 domain-containing protein [Methylobacterium sp.]